MLELLQVIHACAVTHFLKHTNAHLEHCLDHLVFKLFLQTGNVHLDIVYLEQHVGERPILNPTVVRVVEAYQDRLV